MHQAQSPTQRDVIHLLHHAYSRTERERREVYMPGSASIFWCKLNYYFRLLGGLYVFEVAGGMLLLLPKPLLKIAINTFSCPDHVVELLSDKLLTHDCKNGGNLHPAGVWCGFQPVRRICMAVVGSPLLDQGLSDQTAG